MVRPVLYETHCHTPLCGHAVGAPVEYAQRALEKGLKGIVFTCHSPFPNALSSGIRMTPEEFSTYVGMVSEARESFRGELDVRLGLESDYFPEEAFPGTEAWLRELHAREPIDYVLGSVHYHVWEYRDVFFTGDVFEYQKLYYKHLAEAAQTGLYDSLAHPDLVKDEDPEQWDFEEMRPYVAHALNQIAETGVAMELNTSGYNKVSYEQNPSYEQLKMMREREIPVVVGADAHRPDRVGDRFDDALRLLQRAGYSEVNYFLERKRHSVSIELALRSLK
ncbi:MAG: histidinol-phosphatase [Chthoniobacterales bacterium]